MKEIWKDVPCYEGHYQVSNMGRVRSKDRVVKRNGHPMQLKGQIIKPQFNEFGYKKVVLMKERKGKNFKVHQLVALAFIPNPDNLPCINHINGIKENNEVDNIEWCDYSYNHKHAYKTGLKIPYNRNGERNSKAKFTNEEVNYIRRVHKYKSRQFGTMALARKYGVCKDTITNLINGKTYAEAGGF